VIFKIKTTGNAKPIGEKIIKLTIFAPMTILIKQAKIISPDSPHHGKVRDVLVQKGKITQIAKQISTSKAEVWQHNNAHLSSGFADIGTQIGDPGFEHKEDLHSAAKAAFAGGYTTLVCKPNTQPVISTKSEVLYIRNQADSPVDFYPIGAVSKDCKGKEITEMYDMRQAGAVAFSDGCNSLNDSGLMMRSLLYVKPFDGIIINQALDPHLSHGGHLHEGAVSTSLGMKGIPALAEELMLQRDLYLLEYTDSRLHVANVSCANSVSLIRQAKKRGLRVTASVNPMNFAFDDTSLTTFDSNLKVMPPLRENNDIKALKKGLKDGTIDFICTNHTPEDEEGKKLEFVYARPGVIALETTFAVSRTHLNKIIDIEELIQKIAIEPRRIFGLNIPVIAEGETANICLFDPDKTWTFTEKNIYSKSKNTPFVGHELIGKILATMNKSQVWKAF